MKVEVTYSASLDNSAPWKVKASDVKIVDGTPFAKVKPYDPSFVSFVIHEFVALPRNSRPSLVQCDGWTALIKLRNDTVAELSKETEASSGADAMVSLFGDCNSRASKKYTPRFNASQLQDLRENPEVMEFAVPGTDGRPELHISTIKPAHPCDDFHIPLDSDSIEHIVLFMRDAGIQAESLLPKRQYGGPGREKGVWLNGKGIMVQNTARAEGESSQEEGTGRVRRRKLSRVKASESSSVPLQDEGTQPETSETSSVPRCSDDSPPGTSENSSAPLGNE